MKKAKIYIPNKSPMQSGLGKDNKWILIFETIDPTINPLMGWESSSDTLTELKLEFSPKEKTWSHGKCEEHHQEYAQRYSYRCQPLGFHPEK